MSSEKYSKNIALIREWLSKQQHLPQNIADSLLARFLHCCNDSIEQTKSLIDCFFTIRSQAPEIFSNRDPSLPEIQAAFQNLDFIPIPNTTDKNYKVLLYNISTNDPEKYDFINGVKAFFILADVRMLTEENIPDGEIPLFDMKNFTLKHMTKIVLPIVKKYMLYTQEAHPIRLKQIHLLNAPPFVDRCMALVRPFMKSEIGNMIHFHLPQSTTLFDYVPKEFLPEEYGGTAGKLADLKEVWLKRVTDNKEYILDESRWRVDENKRQQGSNASKNMFGMEGSFRSLSID